MSRHHRRNQPSAPGPRARGTARPIRSLGALVAASALAVALVALIAPTTPATAAPAPGPAAASPTPCAATVKACARLSTQEAWLTDGKGTLLRGPVRMNHGGPGRETPTGRFLVQWKNKDHRSREFGGAPMPWSVFFDNQGRAFHGGDPARQSAGCIRLDEENAHVFFENLEPNDEVQILP